MRPPPRLVLACVGLVSGVAIGLAIARGREVVAPLLGGEGVVLGLFAVLVLLVWD